MIAPKIFGHEYVKKAIACLLFGGSRRILPDEGTLRGNINVLLLGDPSTAKSQFLKFVEKTAPICVYTSGKGSSAAGLTATVVRDATSLEFYLEGGAMVLADGGIVCIDEFDKMRTEDRIALHEAMEQQTISIAKAGITTVLNARVGVLAAANPPSGRYDDLRSAEENIDMQNTILSRFDLIFLIRDDKLEDRDIKIAQHVCAVHREINLNQNSKEQNVSTHDDFLKRYICYARSYCEPCITRKAESLLIDQYVKYRSLRRRLVQKEQLKYENNQSNQKTPELPITVRQLEALVRISEALARMILSTEVTESQVEQAIQLFRFSTAQTASAGITGTDYVSTHEKEEHVYVLDIIRRYIAINQLKSESRLVTEVMRVTSVDMLIVHKALGIMRRAKDLLYFPEKRMVKRLH
jgi:DNA replication licensing factor MCM5